MNDTKARRPAGARTLMLVTVALFAALTGVLSQLIIPMPWLVPLSLGNLAGFLAIGLLDWKSAALSQVVWVLLGVAGVPVFSGFGSISRLPGPTGGYIIGYVFCALCAGLILSKVGYKLPFLLLSMAVGMLICYAFGTAWFMVLTKRSLVDALLACVLPFLPGDAIKILLASLLSLKLRPRLQAMRAFR